ncbi:MAG: endolytic transglycosylase MltG [Minisyncoccia bacterium]
MKRKKQRVNPGLAWKTVGSMFSVLAAGIVVFVFYYGFDFIDMFTLSFYENLANPSIRIVRVVEGMRKEEIAEIMANKLGWNSFQKDQFINAHLALNSENLEGHYFPKTYMILHGENPFEVSTNMFYEFSKETQKVKTKTKIINPDTALKIASIIQRESGGKSDMKLISGIIWNRLFAGMKLQIDATLQYAKGNEEDGWWQTVNPEDKKIDSLYNTYIYKELPPSAIANPGLAAIEAAYNPVKTSCMYFLHDRRGRIHCSKTYDEHRRNIDKYY